MNELWIDLLLPILGIIIPVFATVYTVNKRIKSQTKENHQPYLVLKEIEPLPKIDEYKYHYTLVSRNYDKENSNLETNTDHDVNIDLVLQNIGYGVATNIKLYDLLTGKQIIGSQATEYNINQKLFTTFDIADKTEKNIQTRIISTVIEEDGKIREDHNRILCIYQDLNHNVFDFIISINIKKDKKYNFFAYQPSSVSYKKWIIENNKQYKQILKHYKGC